MTRRVFSGLMFAASAMVVIAGASTDVDAQAQTLGTVQLTVGVMADGKDLPAGSYSMRVATTAVTPVVGQGADHAKWIEFLQDGAVKGRELASVVPAAELKEIRESASPSANSAKVEMLRAGEYLRVWANQGDMNYLIHLSIRK